MNDVVVQPQAETAVASEAETPDVPDGGNDRRCIVTGAVLPRTALIRFVVAEDRRVWPDLQEKLPGRGLWVGCEKPLLRMAVQKNLFAKALRAPAPAAPELVENVESQLRQQLLQALGLCRKVGCAVTGFAQVEPTAKLGHLALLLLATDAGADGQSKLSGSFPPERIFRLLTSLELGQALGHDRTVYAGLKPHALTRKVLQAATRFSAFIAQENVAPAAALAQIGIAEDGRK